MAQHIFNKTVTVYMSANEKLLRLKSFVYAYVLLKFRKFYPKSLKIRTHGMFEEQTNCMFTVVAIFGALSNARNCYFLKWEGVFH